MGAPAQAIQKNVQTVGQLLEQKAGELTKSLPKGIDRNRFLQIVFSYYQTARGLRDCDPTSFIVAVMQASQYGLEIGGPLAEAYIVPREDRRNNRKVAQFQLGYRGYQRLVLNAEVVEDIWAELVYENDKFVLDKLPAMPPQLHEPAETDPGKLRAVYAIARFKTGHMRAKVLWRRDVMLSRTQSEAARIDKGPWVTHEGPMWRKTAVAAHCRTLPYRIDSPFAQAMAADAVEPDEDNESATIVLGSRGMIGGSPPALEEAPERLSSLDQMASGSEQDPEPVQPVRRQRSNAQQQPLMRDPGED